MKCKCGNDRFFINRDFKQSVTIVCTQCNNGVTVGGGVSVRAMLDTLLSYGIME